MTHYQPCVGCAVPPATCAVRIRLRDALRIGGGLKITQIRGNCSERVQVLAPGVQVRVRTYVDGDPVPPDGGSDRVICIWPGVVISENVRTRKAIVFVRPGAMALEGGEQFVPKMGNEGFLRLSFKHLTPIPGAPRIDVTTCNRCAKIPTLLDGECGAVGDFHKVRCKHVTATMFFERGLALVGTAWVDPDAEEEIPF